MAAVKLSRLSTHALQALIVGRVIDDRTQAAPANPVRLELKGIGQDWSPETLGLALKQLDDCAFAYYGNPLTAFPDKTQPYQLRLTATVEGYPEKSVDFTVARLDAQPQEVTFTPPMPEIGAMPIRLYRAADLPQRNVQILLTRDAVTLQGLVTNAQDPTIQVSAARIKVKQAYALLDGRLSNANFTATADADGRFTVQLPVAQAVVIEIQKTRYQKQSFTHVIDYSRPVNTVQFTLFPS